MKSQSATHNIGSAPQEHEGRTATNPSQQHSQQVSAREAEKETIFNVKTTTDFHQAKKEKSKSVRK